MQTTGKKISLYFHVPFCTKKCPYCHFYVLPNRLSDHKLLGDSFLLHLEKQLPLIQNHCVTSIYFGGGTPSLFSSGEILQRLPKDPDCEVTIEANPEEATLELFERLLQEGFNRLSLGVQSLDDRSLQTLERTHSAKKAQQAILDAKKAGFQNISIDLMYDLPNQTAASWNYTLDQLSSLPIQHLSLYNLTIEPHTAFHKRKVSQPSSELSLQFLHSALAKLENMGLKRYEISAFAKEGFESRHNTGYWTGRPFLGFGPSAFSYWEGERFRNTANLRKYLDALKNGSEPVDFREKLPYPQNVKELFAVQIRLREGVDPSSFDLPPETFKSLDKLQSLRLIEKKNARIYLTESGLIFYDSVAEELI